MITNGKLEIRLFWAGKGTQATPVRGEYGALIFKKKKKKMVLSYELYL